MMFSRCKRSDPLAMTVVANSSFRYAGRVLCRELQAYKCVHILVLIQQSTVPIYLPLNCSHVYSPVSHWNH